MYFGDCEKILLQSMKKGFVMSIIFKTRREFWLLPLDFAQKRYDVVGGDCRREISSSFDFEYTRNRSNYLIPLHYVILKGPHGLIIFADEFSRVCKSH